MGNVRMRAEQINYGASNVKIALDDLDPKDLIALSARMDTIEAWKATVKAEEKTGASVEYSNALALAAVSLSAEIEASQDLHGYDKPWVGGAGKNKLPLDIATIKSLNTSGTWTGNVYAINNGTIEILTDAADNVTGFKVNGTFSSGTSFNIISSLTLPHVDYIMSGSANFNNDFFIAVQTSGGNVISTATDVTITGTITNALCWIRIGANETVSNKTIQPMLRLSTETDATFAPWENKCPISGRTSVTITDYDSESNTASVTIQLGQTVYGGTLNVTTGVLTITHANIASYNGEAIGEPWISSMDEYTQGGTPTTGAQVVYPLATPTTIQLTAEQLQMLKGYNRLSANSGNITVEAYTGAAWGGDEA